MLDLCCWFASLWCGELHLKVQNSEPQRGGKEALVLPSISKAGAFALKNSTNEWRICWIAIPMPWNWLTEKMDHFCSAPLLGSFLTSLPVCGSAKIVQTPALPHSSPPFLCRTQHPFFKGWSLSLLIFMGSDGWQNPSQLSLWAPELLEVPHTCQLQRKMHYLKVS